MPIFRSLFSVIPFALILTGCSPDSSMTEVRLRTGLENRSNFKNMMNGIAAMPGAFISSGTCRQKNVYAGVESGGNGGDAPLDTKRIDITTAFDGTTPYWIDAPWLVQYATFPPISVPVPRGIPVGVGIIGALYSSTMKDPGQDTCRDFDAAGSPVRTSSVIGHRRITANGPMDVPLRLWVLETNYGFAPSPTPAVGGDPNCANENNRNLNCPTVDFFQVHCATCSSNSRHIRFEYGKDRNRPDRVIHWVAAPHMLSPFNIPNILPLRATLVSSGMVDLATLDITRANFSGGTPSISNQQFTNSGTVYDTISVTERMSQTPPLIGPITQNAPLQLSAGVFQLSWNPAANANMYEIWIAGVLFTSTPTLNYSITGLTAGTAYSAQIFATNNLGSAPTSSSAVSYRTVDAIGPPTVSPGGTGVLIVNFSYPIIGASDVIVKVYDSAGNFLSQSPILGSGSYAYSAATGAVRRFAVVGSNTMFGFYNSPLTSNMTVP